uniref:Uncharacterized protein n=1 Tax=Timema tahoe TaxID=61484 RepID=A0A7R9I9T4_9NEOP|nr:unnamed protein product [Timema tahoe]
MLFSTTNKLVTKPELQKSLFTKTWLLEHYLSNRMQPSLPPWRHYSYTEKQRYDGWFNNLAHPDWGSVGKYRVHSLPS